MPSQRDIDKARDLYAQFRESSPGRIKRVYYDPPEIVASIGHVHAILYDTTRGRRTELYRHDFAAGSRPILAADGETGLLYLVGGRYRFTDRGIVDLTAKGDEIDD